MNLSQPIDSFVSAKEKYKKPQYTSRLPFIGSLHCNSTANTKTKHNKSRSAMLDFRLDFINFIFVFIIFTSSHCSFLFKLSFSVAQLRFVRLITFLFIISFTIRKQMLFSVLFVKFSKVFHLNLDLRTHLNNFFFCFCFNILNNIFGSS